MAPSTSTSPTTVFKDALTTFVQAASHALALAEESSKAELSLALQNERDVQHERDELRRERDKLVQDKTEALIELQKARGEIERWKTASEKSEWMIGHQTETIAQLRREAQQWKDQLMRVEEERARLSTRVDELVAQQLFGREPFNPEPLTPRSQGPQAYSRSSALSNSGASTSQQYTANSASSTSEVNGYTTDNDVSGRLSRLSSGRPPQSQVSSTSTVVSRKKSTRTTGPGRLSASRQAVSYPYPQPQTSSARSTGKQTVIRRVHAVVEVPVKEESVDSANILAGGQVRSPSVDADSVSISYSDGAEEDAHDVDESVLFRRAGQPRRDGRANKNGAGASYEDGSVTDGNYYERNSRRDDDDVDELMLGSEDNRTELYGSEEARAGGLQTPPPPRRAQTQVQSGKYPGSSGKKRNSPYPAATSKKVRRR